MSSSDSEDGLRERSTTEESDVVVMGDVSMATAATAVTTVARRRADDELLHDAVAVGDSDAARKCRDADMPDDHEDGSARLHPVVANPSANMSATDMMIQGFIRGIQFVTERREKWRQAEKAQINTTVLANPPSSTAIADSVPHSVKEYCLCDNHQVKRAMLKKELEKAVKFQSLWTELREYIRTIFDTILITSRASESSQSQHSRPASADIYDTVIQLCKRDSHQLFMRLVSQVQEFVVEVKIHILALLHDTSENNLAEAFLTGLLDDYNALVWTATQISELVKPLRRYLFKFKLTWDCFMKKLYQMYIYNDPLVQHNLPTFIGQLRKLLPLKGSEYQGLVRRYLSFDDEMTRIGNLWPETEPWMEKYNAEQTIRMKRLKQIKETWELFTTTFKMVEYSKWNIPPHIGNELLEIRRQITTLVAPTSGIDSHRISQFNPTSDPNLDNLSLPPSIDIFKDLVDDWNKANRQKLTDIAGSLIATEADVAGQSNSNNHDYARPTCNIVQYATKSIKTRNDDCITLENGLLNESHTYRDKGVSHTATQCTLLKLPEETDDTICYLSDSPEFSEEFLNYAAAQVKKDLDGSNDEETKTKESSRHDMLNKDTGSQTSEPKLCPCVCQHASDIVYRKNEVLENPPCPCLLNSRRKNTCPCLKKSVVKPAAVIANGCPKVALPTVPVTKTNQESSQKSTVKADSTQSTQIKTRHSTTQTSNTLHTHHIHHGNTHSHVHGPLMDLTKNTQASHPRFYTHNNQHTPHSCHKQANVEHIKRVSCNDLSSGDGDCSDSCSSQEDSCSTSSSAHRDTSRHCDCCYCEVFGHGVPSVAPVSRNYNEMRERLRQILTKKKAKKCKTVGGSPPKSPSETSPPDVSSEFKQAPTSVLRLTPPLFTAQQEERDQRNLEELLEFIEGNQNNKKDNNKKAEKKARQKQRKLEEKLKKDRQEAQRQKLIELQKKTPEVTITVVDPKKPAPRKFLPQCDLPEVSILPTSPRVSLPIIKQLNDRKKDKQEVCSNSNNNSGSTSINSLNNKTKTSSANLNVKSKSINNTDKCEIRNVNSNQGNKNSVKNDKIEISKGNKSLTNINTVYTKNDSSNNTDKLSNVNLLDKKLTKKERKKLKKEMKKLEEEKIKESESLTQTESQPQIVTIKRVLESNSVEPTVTITLKGQTPAEDKVLFTLVNGQTKEPTQKLEQEQNQGNSGKKKKVKTNGNNNTSQQGNKLQQSNNSKQHPTKNCDGKNAKQQQTNNEKLKTSKQADEKKTQQQTVNETKNSKSKKDKKNTENKENVLQQQNTLTKTKNQQNANKKPNKTNTPPQTPVSQKQQQSHSIINESATNKKTKKQQHQQQQLDKSVQSNINKSNKNISNNNANKISIKNEPQKNVSKMSQTTKQRSPMEVQNTCTERVSSPLSSQFRDIGPNSKINIENLKLPPGITITKVDAPVKPLPIRSAPMPKPVNPPKQTTIIAAPMSGVQSSYASPQAGGNVIVVDTGKLKQDLLPKANEKDIIKDSQTSNASSSKKKKKKKNSANSNNVTTSSSPVQNDSFANDHGTIDEPARILHNPGTNMVTIRNPSFGPMKVQPTQQAAIIKVSENGMVTIRSPALQQAINAGLTSAPRPDYIVKGDMSSNRISTTMTSDGSNVNTKHANGVMPSSLAELRSRLTPTDCASLSGLANIQISKVTSGQPIPENGINLKGTSVTLTKVRPADKTMEDVQHSKSEAKEATDASIMLSGNGNGSGSKSKKKKKRGNGGTRQCGDDWNLVESVFTPKDIDLEDGEMDDAERELEAFKRFCLQSVPPPRKEKVNLNIKDIVLKKKSSSSTSSSATTSSSAATATVIAAN